MPLCSCKEHGKFSKDTSYKVYRISSNKIRAQIINYLIENGNLTRSCVYICTSCAAYAEKQLQSSDESAEDELVNQIVGIIRTNNISEKNVKRIAEAIGHRESNLMRSDIRENVSGQYKNIDFLKTCDIEKWVMERDSVLTSFLESLCGKQFKKMSSSEKTKVVFAIEHLYSLVANNIILPFSFSVNLLNYYVCSSKTVCNLYSSAHPAGSYSSMLNWIDQHSQNPVQVPLIKDVITYFDNNQVLARNWRVRFDAKAILSTVTTVVHFFSNPSSDLQTINTLSPRYWLYNSSISDYIKEVLNMTKYYEDIFRELRENFIKDRLQVLAEQQRPGLTSPEDTISTLIQKKKKTKFTDKSRCKIDSYSFVDHNHKEPPSIHMGNPISVNPCSFDSVKTVLQNLKKELGIPNARKWSIIGCDGLPYLLCQRIIKDNPEFQDLLVQPGLGHFEINMAKAVIKLVWQVLGLDLAKLLGYRTPKALQSCLDGNDHHKAMQFIEILLLGTGDELLQPFLAHCFETSLDPSAKGFFTWCQAVQDPNYKFLLEAIYTYALAVYLFRAGVRRNNSKVILAARVKFSPLYFGLGKTNYQQIEMADLLMRVCAPVQVRQFLQDHESFTQSGHPSKGEGCDFILEAKNRQAKSWLPSGAPKEKHWQQTCRNLDNLEEINRNIKEQLGVKDVTEDSIYHTDLRNEIFQWRAELRESEYLLSPHESKDHTSLSNKLLDHELVNFSQKCKNNRIFFFQETSNQNSLKPSISLEPIFFTSLDRSNFNSIENKTKTEISAKIEDYLEDLLDLDYDAGEQKRIKWIREIKTGTKKLYIQYYKEILELLDSLQDVRDVQDFDLQDEELTDSASGL